MKTSVKDLILKYKVFIFSNKVCFHNLKKQTKTFVDFEDLTSEQLKIMCLDRDWALEDGVLYIYKEK